jgi:hypothetical protein
MPRGVVPRQPARTGRQDKVRVARALPVRQVRQEAISRQQACSCGDGRPREPAPSEVEGSRPRQSLGSPEGAPECRQVKRLPLPFQK